MPVRGKRSKITWRYAFNPTRALVQALKRNHRRFPEDFVFQLTSEVLASLRSQIVISKPARALVARNSAQRRGASFPIGMSVPHVATSAAIDSGVDFSRMIVYLRNNYLTPNFYWYIPS